MYVFYIDVKKHTFQFTAFPIRDPLSGTMGFDNWVPFEVRAKVPPRLEGLSRGAACLAVERRKCRDTDLVDVGDGGVDDSGEFRVFCFTHELMKKGN